MSIFATTPYICNANQTQVASGSNKLTEELERWDFQFVPFIPHGSANMVASSAILFLKYKYMDNDIVQI